MNNELLERFIRYVSIDTQSDDVSETTPSTLKQLDLLKLLSKELTELGIENEIDEFSRLYAYIPGNDAYDSIGVCSHVDTALECSGANVKPQIIKNYDLSDIKLGDSGLVLSPKQFKKLNELKGKTVITTSGDTLLGGDDKAGDAIIMEVAKRLVKLPKDSHRPMSILFTPDEEVGRGAEHFSKEKYRCKFAYTVDGDDPKYISIENFNAKSASIKVTGKSIHPGEAYLQMINASTVLAYYMSLINKEMVPELTKDREGFNHLVAMSGEVEHAEAHYILRNHDKDILEKQVENFNDALEETKKKFPGAKIELVIKESYKNMFEVIKEHPECKEHIENVYRKLNKSFEYLPIRGGTDGATFSYLGVPCPNLGTGSYNHHGRYEFAVLEEMEELVEIVSEIYSL